MFSRVLSNATLVAAACAAALAVVFLTGCRRGRPETPEALFEKIAEYNLAGEAGKIWDLFTPDRQEREIQAIDRYRDILRKNPGMQKFAAQYKSTPEEFQRLSYVELVRRENQGNERVLVGAKIVDKQPDPRKPDETLLTIQLVGDSRQVMRVRKMADGYGLVEIRPVF